jgi:transposase InsO family protein
MLVEWHYIAPGKPQQNAFAESFIGRLRDYNKFTVAVSDTVMVTDQAARALSTISRDLVQA